MSVELMPVKIVRMFFMACSILFLWAMETQAQCRSGGGQSSGSTGATALSNLSVPYNQFGLNSGYSQNALGPLGYNNQFLAQVAANDQAQRELQAYTAMRAQATGIMVRAQVAQAKAMRKQLDQASKQMRLQAEKDRAEAIAAREERAAARRAKESGGYASDRSSLRMVSLQ